MKLLEEKNGHLERESQIINRQKNDTDAMLKKMQTDYDKDKIRNQ